MKQVKYLTDDGVKYLVGEIDKLYLKPEQLSAMTKNDIVCCLCVMLIRYKTKKV